MEQNYVTVILCMRYTAAAPPASGYELSPGEKRLLRQIGNESVPKIIINETIVFFLNCNQQIGNFKP